MSTIIEGKMKKIFLILFAAACIFNISIAQLAGPLSGTLGPGTFTVVGGISVQNGDSLTIAPGTRFNFTGYYEFDVDGYLYAVGTENDSITFQPSDTSFTWGGIDFNSIANNFSRLGYCLVRGGYASGAYPESSGGGILCYGSSPIISNCTVSGNAADSSGGGVACNDNSNPTITDCLISGNSANLYGGGISVFYGSSLTIRRSTVCENSSSGGGGILAMYNSSSVIDCCLILDNSSTGVSGGVSCHDSSTATITNCIFSGNSAEVNTGAFGSSSNCTATVSNCVFNGNYAARYGGAIIFSCTSTLNIDHSIICGNSGGLGEGGIALGYNSAGTIVNCTISGNSGTAYGSGIDCANSSLNMINTIVEGNTGLGAVHFDEPTYVSITHCDFFNNEHANFIGDTVSTSLGLITSVNLNGDSCDIFQNIYCDPLYYSTAGDSAFRLTENSPCIDAGDPGAQLDPDSTIADIGAFYFNHSSYVIEPPATAIPEHTMLSAFPNPFNQRSLVSFSLKREGLIRLAVYDIQGREAAVLAEGFYPAGAHQAGWDASGMASGVYFARFSAGEAQRTVKLLLLK